MVRWNESKVPITEMWTSRHSEEEIGVVAGCRGDAVSRYSSNGAEYETFERYGGRTCRVGIAGGGRCFAARAYAGGES